MKLADPIAAIERRRDSRVLVLAASNLELDALPVLFDTLRRIGPTPRLDVVFHCRGGAVTAARRIGLLLDQATERLTFIVPHHCQSAGTITVLAAREVIAGPVAIFSPIDPQLQAESGGGGPGAVSAEDIRLFADMARDWFGLPADQANAQALATLGAAIFPTTLTAFHRAILETRAIGEELLALHMADAPAEARTRIVERLLHGFHSHGYPITREDLAGLGLPIAGDAATEDDAWAIAREIRASIGGGVRRTVEDDWVDTLIATREGMWSRRRARAALEPTWAAEEIA